MGKRLSIGIAICALLLGSVATAAAQGFAGGLRGVVKDANGVVPGAEITLTNEGTAAARSVVTNDEGGYAFENVLPATYRIKVALTGFKTLERAGIKIGTQQILTLDLTLEVGQLQETITVTGAAPLIDTSNASVASTLDKATLETLPTAGRNAFFLAVTVPNVIPSGDPQFVRQQDQTNSALLSLAGGPRRGNNYTLEGVSITDLRNRAVIIPNIESVEEVKVQVSTFDAEMGRTGGGVFNTIGKSGTNNFHGSGLYQTRPSGTLGRFYFAEKADVEKPESYFHLGGGSFGGPIIHNRTFFWASSEGYQTFSGRNAVLTLPTERERKRRLLPERRHHLRPAHLRPRDRYASAVPGQRDSGEPHQRRLPQRAYPCATAHLWQVAAGGRGAPGQGAPDHWESRPPLEREADLDGDVRLVRLV